MSATPTPTVEESLERIADIMEQKEEREIRYSADQLRLAEAIEHLATATREAEENRRRYQ